MSEDSKHSSRNKQLQLNTDDLENNLSLTEADSPQNGANSAFKISLKSPSNGDGDSDIQVKLFVNDSSNAREKCIGEAAMASFSGLSKEELLKYANDPFWIKMRLLLFVFFWIVWIAMFIGAVAIIVLAPPCELPKPPKWYEKGPLYELDAEKFVADEKPQNILQSLKSKLDYLSDLKISGLILSPIFHSEEKDESVLDFTSLNENMGTFNDFEELIKEAEDKKISIVLTFIPNHSSNKHIWFNNSIAKKAPYDDYYIWAPASGITSNGSKIPPNNWLSVNGKFKNYFVM